MEPRPFTEGEKKSLEFLFDDIVVYDNYAQLKWRSEEYIIAPIGDTAEYACTSSEVLITGYSFSKIKEQLNAG